MTVRLLDETPAVLSLGKLCENHLFSYHWISGQKPHLTQKGKRIDFNKSNYVPFVVLGLSTRSSTTPTPTSSSSSSSQDSKADTPKIQYPKEVEVRVRSYGETRCINPQKPKTKIKMNDAKKYKAIYCMTWIGCKISEKFWSMNVLLQSDGETLCLWIKTLPVLLMNYQWSREQKWNRIRGKHGVYTHFPKDPNCDICLKTKITRASCRRRAGTVMPRQEHFGDLMTTDHKILSEESESCNNHRYAVVVQDLTTQWLQSYPCKTKTSQETQKTPMKFLEPTRKPNYPGIIVRQRHTDQKQMGLLREQCAE